MTNLHEMAPFSPRAAKIAALVAALLFGLLMLAIVLFVPGLMLLDQIGFIGLGVAVGWLMSRFAGVRAVPTTEGLTVRNLLRTTQLEWPQILSVRFGDRPWPQLDLSDGQTLAVLGIQRADGVHAQQEAVRLATLVERHGSSDHS